VCGSNPVAQKQGEGEKKKKKTKKKKKKREFLGLEGAMKELVAVGECEGGKKRKKRGGGTSRPSTRL